MNGPHVLLEAGSEFFSSRRLAAKSSNFFGQLEAESRWQLFFCLWDRFSFWSQRNSKNRIEEEAFWLFDFSCVAERSKGSLNVHEYFCSVAQRTYVRILN